MTNTVFFSAIYRDDESVSSSSRSETSEPPQTVAQASSSAYSVISKAWLACAGAHLEADEDVDDSTANTSAPASNTNDNESVMEYSKLKRISYMELRTATSEFKSAFPERGAFGSVFKGWINESTLTATASGKGIAVAVKVVKGDYFFPARVWTVTEWLEEINYAGRFHHPNLVRTLAYCTEGKQAMVVYEFMPRGSLADHLFQRGSDSEPLSWSLRLKIALGAAKGLNFLHMNDAVHGNIRPSNILIDLYYNSKLSFGVARDSCSGASVDIDGFQLGPVNYENEYTDPECIRRGFATATGDVYSFGLVLLAILFGRKVTYSELDRAMQRNAVDQLEAVNKESDQLVPFLDRSFLGDECAMRDATKVIKLALLCLFQEPHRRIAMDLVDKDLTVYMDRCSKGEQK